MPSAKDIRVEPISSADARRVVTRYHYSGKVVGNSQLHLGVFLAGRCLGALSFGPSLDKGKIVGLVRGTGWNQFLELNRMALSDALPRNSESRALSIAMRLLRQHAPQVQWVVTFADGTQCGDGTIYRASGFALTGIKRNTQIIEFPDGLRETRLVLTDARRPRRIEMAKRYGAKIGGAASLLPFLAIGARIVPGFQLRYVYFLDPTARDRLTVPIIPFAKIAEVGAGMYRGQPRAGSADSGTPGVQLGRGGANPTPALT